MIIITIKLLLGCPLLLCATMNGDDDQSFLYFAYGSNLLAERIHVNNPSAVRVGPAKLQDYRLSFALWSPRWGGCSATVVPCEGRRLWGAVWRLASGDLPGLDRQEGVASGVYVPVTLDVETPSGERLSCRSYRLRGEPPAGPPSEVYWRVIVEGAKQTGLPRDYLRELLEVEHNGYRGPVDVPIDTEKLLRADYSQ